jgi:predicted nucleic acid-binding protein
MIVVSDTTPISELVKVGYLYLLYELFEQVLIPQEVYAELTTGKHPAVKIVSCYASILIAQKAYCKESGLQKSQFKCASAYIKFIMVRSPSN